MNDVKVGRWVVNVGDVRQDMTLGKSYYVKSMAFRGVGILNDIGESNCIANGNYKLAPQKYSNPPREEYRELCEAWLRGGDINYISGKGNAFNHILFNNPTGCYMIAPESVLPKHDEPKERIKKQLLNIDADKLAQLILDAGVEL